MRTILRPGMLPLAALALLTAGLATGQQRAPMAPPGFEIPSPPVQTPPPVREDGFPPTSRTVPPPPVVVPTPPPPPTVEDLIGQLEQLQKQRAELDQREKALVGQIQDRLKQQGEKLSRLGVKPPPPPEVPTPR